MEAGRGKVTDGMGGMGQDMGWDEEGMERSKGGKGGQGLQPLTSIPGAAADATVQIQEI